MIIIAVDDERRSLKMLEKALAQAAPGAHVQGFTSAAEALAYARDRRVDVAFLDIMMGEMNGLILARALKDIYGATNIIFVTGYSEYAGSAFELRASGYVTKPVSVERVKVELDNLRSPVAMPEEPRVRIQCFGGFAVYVEGRPLIFSRAKPKELLAYLVHRQGAAITNPQIAAVLWEDKAYTLSIQSNTRNVIAQLMHALKEAGIEHIITRVRNSTAVKTGSFACDYYDYLRGKTEAINAYAGEYMSDYSWSEFVIANLDKKRR